MAKQLIGRESHVLTPYFRLKKPFFNVCVMANTPHYAALISKRPSIPLNTLFYLSICSSLVLMENAGASFITGIQTPEVLLGLIAIHHNVSLCVVELSRALSCLPLCSSLSSAYIARHHSPMAVASGPRCGFLCPRR